ncbi:hypothetical protein T439DRAFT_383569 [Meredithblackwellia eburnea MCA 4105]
MTALALNLNTKLNPGWQLELKSTCNPRKRNFAEEGQFSTIVFDSDKVQVVNSVDVDSDAQFIDETKEWLAHLDLGEEKSSRPLLLSRRASLPHVRTLGRVNYIIWTAAILFIFGNLHRIKRINLDFPSRLSAVVGRHSCQSHTITDEMTSHSSSSYGPATNLDSTSPLFTLALSPSLLRCNAFKLTIARVDPSYCRQVEDEIFVSNNSLVGEYVRKVLGPDSFAVRVKGSQRLVVERPTGFERDRCRYEFEVGLETRGRVELEVVWMHQGYDAFIEDPNHEMERLITPLTTTPIRLQLCNKNTPCHPSNDSGETPTESPPSSSYYTRLRTPACDHHSRTLVGAYLLPHKPLPSPIDQPDHQPKYSQYDFTPTTCKYQHAGLRFRSHQQCFGHRHRALLVGDSHARGVFDSAVHRLRGFDELTTAFNKSTDSRAAVFGELELAFIWNSYLEGTFTCDLIGKYDSVTLSFGAHPAAFQCPTTSEYIHRLTSLFEQIPSVLGRCPRDQGRPTPRFIFLNNPAWRVQKEFGRDCRTSQRLDYWNERALQLSHEFGWITVDSMALTRPFTEESPDGVHYLGTSASDAILDDWIAKAGFCPQADKAGHDGLDD